MIGPNVRRFRREASIGWLLVVSGESGPAIGATRASPDNLQQTTRNRQLLPRRVRVIQGAEPPVAGGKAADRAVQVADAEVRPEHVAHVQLGVADLPEQVVADAHLPG